MKFKIEGDNAIINIFDLIHDGIQEERKQELAESLTCSDFVIKSVLDQVLYGCTEQGFSGCDAINPDSEKSFTPLQKARRFVAKESSNVAKKEISQLQRRLESEIKQKDENIRKYYKLYHWLNANNINFPLEL